MTQTSRPSIFTIPVHRAFADALVAGVIDRHGGDPLSLAAGMILLPNNRAVTAVRDAFIRHSGGALLLPRLVALGDEDLDEAIGAALDRIDDDDAPLPPSMPAMHRRFRLTQLVADQRPGLPAGEALRLGDGLARVFDALAIEDVPLDALSRMERDEPLADHWETAFALLQSLARQWPEILASEGVMDRSRRRNALYDRTAERWRTLGLPAEFVIAAGISTTAPAVARLLKTIVSLPGGAVVLPHLDLTMADDWWDSLGDDPRRQQEDARPPLDSHPHLHLKLLLDRMDMRREDVQLWPGHPSGEAPAHRQALVRNSFAPAAFTADWLDIPAAERRADGITLVDCATPAEEALTIALAMREVLETPGRTAALVTPDRAIATRVSGYLSRWGIEADDSAGQPLVATKAGELALSLAAALAGGFAPVDLIALLSHPMVKVQDDEARRLWIDHVRDLDLALRGPRPAAGLTNLGRFLAERAIEPRKAESERLARAELHSWWQDSVLPMLDPLAAQLPERGTTPLAAMLAALRTGLSTLSDDLVWTNADGRALSALLEEVESEAPLFQLPVATRELVPLLRQLMRDVAVRPPQGGHPRLFIWGLIEGRLQRADRMILAGLNEGQWPQKPSPDPWLPPVIRRRLGLPGLERASGLAAHDFAIALGSPDVLITRSQREGTAPTVASRLLLRLMALVGDGLAKGEAATLVRIAAALDACDAPQPMPRPAFIPDADRRPKALSVTEVDTLLADPFAFYARNALGLSRLDPLDAEPTPAWRGTLVHSALERWLTDSNRSVDAIRPIIDELLAGPGVSAVLRALWAPRLYPPLDWAVGSVVSDQIDSQREPIEGASEARGATTVDGITLSGKADRIDRLADKSLAIVDYKTGGGPHKNAVESLFALQLGLLGLIAENGGFTKDKELVSQFEYWRMNKATTGDRKGQLGWRDVPFKKTKDATINAGNFVEEARQRLAGAIARWLNGDDAFTAKLVPEFAPYADYDQLMRLEEWHGRETGGTAPGEAA